MGDVFGGCCQGDATPDDEKAINLESLIRNVSICIVTWNVNGNHPRSAALDHLLYHKNAHLYVIGLQEIIDLNAQNMMLSKSRIKDNSIVWEQEIDETLNKESNTKKYFHIETVKLFGILLIIFAKKTVYKSISCIMTSHCAAGIGGVGANKGAVGIRFTLDDTSICFICCHLAANKKKLKERNENYSKIMQQLSFKEEIQGVCTQCSAQDMDINITQHDIVFMFGDMNYRLDYDDNDVDKVYNLIKEEKWSELLKHDQLLTAMEDGNVFKDFNESKIDFQPSYKFEIGTNEYSTVRMPAYCDRILWKLIDYGQSLRKINGVVYETQLARNMSDHKPVVGLYNIHQ